MDTNEFNGVFYFTNDTNEDFTAFWNNEEYTFPQKKTSPMIMPNETSTNIQEIRKRFAYKLAMREFYKGKEYERLVKLGNKSQGGIPPSFNENLLEPMIQSCLKPLPIEKAKVKKGKKADERIFKGSKAISDKDNPNYVFREESEDQNIPKKGEQPNVFDL